MFGWLSSLFGRKEEKHEAKVEESKEAGLSDLILLLEKKIDEKNTSIEPALREMYKKIADSSLEFSNSLNNLEAATFKDKIDEAVLNVTKSYRSSMLKAFNEMFTEIGKSVNYNLNDFVEYFSNCVFSKTDAEGKVMRYVNPLKEVFPSEMGSVMKASEKLSQTMSEVSKFVSSKQEEFKPLLDSLSLSRDLSSHSSKIAETDSEISKVRSEIETLNGNRDKINEMMSDLLGSEKWAEFQAHVQEAETIQRKRGDLLSIAVQTISPLDKAMKRISKTTFDDLQFLNLYITDPADAFIKDADQSVMGKIIAKIKEEFSKGTLEIEEKKEQKIIDNISEIESKKILVGIRSEYTALEESLKSVQEKISSSEIYAVKSTRENELKMIASKLSDADSRLKVLESLRVKLDENSNELSNNLKAAVANVMGEDFKLKL